MVTWTRSTRMNVRLSMMTLLTFSENTDVRVSNHSGMFGISSRMMSSACW
jgi:hypothetical protein